MMKIEPYNQDVTNELMELLLTADPDREGVLSYLPGAEILVARNEGALVGVGVLIREKGGFELKNLAVLSAYRGKGIAKLLITELKLLAKSMGARVLEVGTGNSSLSQLALYQKCGFRMQSIERNFYESYPEPIFENGIRCIDMVRLRVEL